MNKSLEEKGKGNSSGIGTLFSVVMIVLIGFAVWGNVKKPNDTTIDTLNADSNTHPHIFSYSPGNETVWVGTHTGVYELNNDKFQRTLFELRSNDIMGLEIDPRNPKRIFVSGHGFVKRSVDGGKTWQVIENGLPNLAKPDEPDAHYLTMDPDDSNHLFVMLAGEGENLYETKDGGNTWRSITSLPAGAYSISMISGAPSSILAATEAGLIRYDIQSGTVRENQLTNGPVYQVLTLPNNEVVIMTESGFQKSIDFKTWSAIDVKLNGEMPLGIKSAKEDGSRLVIITDRYSVYESSNGGENWTKTK
ncbi:hypothetical protein [Paenibacillus sp. PDC88]|uniref:WD40/YVTN/BNR-like repeat-containing protein n=1 Tax=Paenibacillus provencensis TaxID=441151 RepID=A0ABW3PXH1_9BACL|nr:hypothetical protein [Paenibacillus sp. PDC88]SDX61925.1 hypothetical protein SAMN05518848_11035 [Paenibacillus sp. PDC88]